MTITESPHLWRAASNGAGKRRFFVVRGDWGQTEVLSDKRGRYRRFSSLASAARTAQNLNDPQIVDRLNVELPR